MNAAHDDVLAKMDALLKKHHDALARAPTLVDFPVLTEIVEEKIETPFPVLTEIVEIEVGGHSASGLPDHETFSDSLPPQAMENSVSEDHVNQHAGEVAEELLHEFDVEVDAGSVSDNLAPVHQSSALDHLDPELRSLLEQQLSAQIIASLDQALAAMLDQFSEHLESMVSDAVTQELRHQLPELLHQATLRNKL